MNCNWFASLDIAYILALNFIAMCPSDNSPRLYACGAAKKREKNRRLDNAVADTSEIQRLNFVATTPSEGGGTSTTWTGSSRVRPAARQPDGSRSLSGRHIAKRNETGNPSSRNMLKVFRHATSKVRGFDSFRRC